MTENKSEIQPVNEYKIMDTRDENQILAELQGHYLTEFVYSFKAGGRDVIGLSWAGVKELAYRYGGIQVEECKIEEKADFWLVTCKAVDVQRKNSRFGVATQSKMMKRRDGSSEVDEFALQKATSKAQRNAIRALMPEIAVKQYIDQFLSEKEAPAARVVPVNVTPKPAPPSNLPKQEQIEQALLEAKLLDLLVIAKEEDNITIHYKTFLNPDDFKTVCGVAERFGGRWVKDEGIWVIPA